MPDINLIPQKGGQGIGDVVREFLISIKPTLTLAITLIVGALVIYFGLIGISLYMGGKLSNIKNQVTFLQSQEDVAKENSMADFSNRLDTLSTILNEHIYFSRIFPFISRITLPQVVYGSFQADATTGSLKLDGAADSFSTMAKQLVLFYDNNQIKSVDISNIKIGQNGGVTFSVNLSIDPSIYTEASIIPTTMTTTGQSASAAQPTPSATAQSTPSTDQAATAATSAATDQMQTPTSLPSTTSAMQNVATPATGSATATTTSPASSGQVNPNIFVAH